MKSGSCGCGRGKERPNQRRLADKTCLVCKARYHPLRDSQKYCSKECLHNSGNYVKGGRKHQCKKCGVTFQESRKDAQYCSRECADMGYIDSVNAEQREITCKGCQKEFTSKIGGHKKWPKFCSRKCYSKGHHPAKTMSCLTCDKSFKSTYRETEYHKYCSKSCADEGLKTGSMVKCVICGKSVWRFLNKVTANTNHYCSAECRAYKSADLCGKSWKDGTVRHVNGYDMLAFKRRRSTTTGHVTRLVYKARYRLTVEEYIGRTLLPTEPVWHINQDREDDNLENLYVFPTVSKMSKAIARDNLPSKTNLHQLKNETALALTDENP